MHRGLESGALRFPDHVAVLGGDERWTFAELDRAANAAAGHLVSLGVGPGDRVAVMTSNRPEFVVVVQATSKLGAAPVLLNSSWKAREVATALGLTGPRCAVADGAAAAPLVDQLGAAAVRELGAPRAPTLPPWPRWPPSRAPPQSSTSTRPGPRPSSPGPAQTDHPMRRCGRPTTPSSCSAPAPPTARRRCATPTAPSRWLPSTGAWRSD